MKKCIALVCAICVCIVFCSCEKKAPVAFSGDVAAGESVYVDVLSIVPKHTLTSGTSVSEVVCKCATLSGEIVWVCMSTSQYKNLDPAASFSDYLGNFYSGAFYPNGIRIQGRSISAEKKVSGLAAMSAPIIIDYSESAEGAIDSANQISPVPYVGGVSAATPVYADIVSLAPFKIVADNDYTVQFVVCDCTTLTGEKLPLYISVQDYKAYFDADADFSVVNMFAEAVELAESVHIYGLMVAPEDLAGDLSDEIPVELFVFDSCEIVPEG